MDFQLSPEQIAVQDTLRRFAGARYGFEHRRALAKAGSIDERAWAFFAEMGLLSLTVPEDAGGLGGSAIDLVLVMQELGAAMFLEPYLETVVLCGGLLQRTGSHADVLGAMMSGSVRLGFAHLEPQARFQRSDVVTTAREASGGWRLDGRKSLVVGAPFASHLLVTARVHGDVTDADGLAAFLVNAQAAGIRIGAYSLHDGKRAADVLLSDVVVGPEARLGCVGALSPHLDAVIDLATVALCGEAIGIMDTLVRSTVEHLQQRQQFGQPLAKFQALRHRVADMAIRLEQARAITLLGASHVDDTDARSRARHAAAAKALVGRCARFVGQQAVQLHGAMGLTEELPVGHLFRRLNTIEFAFGDSAHHIRCFANLPDEPRPVPDRVQ